MQFLCYLSVAVTKISERKRNYSNEKRVLAHHFSPLWWRACYAQQLTSCWPWNGKSNDELADFFHFVPLFYLDPQSIGRLILNSLQLLPHLVNSFHDGNAIIHTSSVFYQYPRHVSIQSRWELKLIIRRSGLGLRRWFSDEVFDIQECYQISRTLETKMEAPFKLPYVVSSESNN